MAVGHSRLQLLLLPNTATVDICKTGQDAMKIGAPRFACKISISNTFY